MLGSDWWQRFSWGCHLIAATAVAGDSRALRFILHVQITPHEPIAAVELDPNQTTLAGCVDMVFVVWALKFSEFNVGLRQVALLKVLFLRLVS
jgi:hypothetical protein